MSEVDTLEINAIESLTEPQRLYSETEPTPTHDCRTRTESSSTRTHRAIAQQESSENSGREAPPMALARTRPLEAKNWRNALSRLHGGTKQKQADGISHRESDHLWWVSGALSTFAAAVLLGPIFAGIAFVGAAFFTDMTVRGLTDSEEVPP